MTKLRHGFKTEAEALAREVRAELGLAILDRLDPRQLACHLDIPVLGLSDLAEDLAGAQHFLTVEREVFSAVTVFRGRRRIIVHNDSHSPARQNSNLTHELSHGLLLHEPAPALDNLTGCRKWDDANEAEASWLGGVLLVTKDMALAVAKGRLTRKEACERFGVSEDMLRWRLGMTGAIKRVARERARWRNNGRQRNRSRGQARNV